MMEIGLAPQDALAYIQRRFGVLCVCVCVCVCWDGLVYVKYHLVVHDFKLKPQAFWEKMIKTTFTGHEITTILNAFSSCFWNVILFQRDLPGPVIGLQVKSNGGWKDSEDKPLGGGENELGASLNPR